MLNHTSANLVRLAGPLLALCVAGAALAEPNNGNSSSTLSRCYAAAEFQYDLAIGQCDPNQPWAYANCRDTAQAQYVSAIAACSLKSVSAVRGAGGSSLEARPSRPVVALGQSNTVTSKWTAGSGRPIFISAGGNRPRR